MKVEHIDDKLIVYIKGKPLNNLEEVCTTIIANLKKYYHIELKGFYDVNVYIDKEYGMVLEFILEELDFYYDYSKVDLHIIKKDITFLYCVDDILDLDVHKFYLYHNAYYLTLDELKLTDWEYGRLVFSNTKEILDHGKLIIV